MSITFLCGRLHCKVICYYCVNVFYKSFCCRFSPNKKFHCQNQQNTGIRLISAFTRPMYQESNFQLSDYDCIGFDLDNTLCVYKLRQFYNLVYDAGAKYLVEKKKYDKQLLQPWQDYEDFIFKGLVADFKKGNFLKVDANGYIFRATHGTRRLTTQEIIQMYGPERTWLPVVGFKTTCAEPDKDAMRVFKDYFDLAGSLLSARIVDLLEQNGEKQFETFNFWPDVYEALMDNFQYKAYNENSGEYFPALKKDAGNYIYECSNSVKSWLKSMRQQNKIVFLITSSHIDYASLLASYCLGKDWLDYFDVCISNARKPGFFLEPKDKRPFLHLDDIREGDPVSEEDLTRHNCYSQGNWQSLNTFFQKLTMKANPKIVYFGDSLNSDVLPLPQYSNWDPVAIVEEMAAEALLAASSESCREKLKFTTPDKMTFLTSKLWGSFFYDNDAKTGDTVDKINTLWGWVIKTKSKLAVPNLDCIADLPLNYTFGSFKEDGSSLSGFYPTEMNPLNM